MLGFNETIDGNLVDMSTIKDRLELFEATLSIDESITFKAPTDDSKLHVSATLSQAKYDELVALFAADRETRMDDVSNNRREAKLHRASKAAKNAIDNTADADLKATLTKMRREYRLLNRDE